MAGRQPCRGAGPGLGEAELAAWIPWREAGTAHPPLPAEPPARLGLALALAFQLLNTVEEHAAESMRQLRESAEGAEAERGLWAALARLRGAEFSGRRPRLSRTLALRSAPLRLLHRQQIALLRRWRGEVRQGNDAAAQAVFPELLLTINAIASGLRTTG